MSHRTFVLLAFVALGFVSMLGSCTVSDDTRLAYNRSTDYNHLERGDSSSAWNLKWNRVNPSLIDRWCGGRRSATS